MGNNSSNKTTTIHANTPCTVQQQQHKTKVEPQALTPAQVKLGEAEFDTVQQHQVVIMGAPLSGKSTLIRHVKKIVQESWSAQDVRNLHVHIVATVIKSIQAVETLQIPKRLQPAMTVIDKVEPFRLYRDTETIFEQVVLTDVFINALETVWNDVEMVELVKQQVAENDCQTMSCLHVFKHLLVYSSNNMNDSNIHDNLDYLLRVHWSTIGLDMHCIPNLPCTLIKASTKRWNLLLADKCIVYCLDISLYDEPQAFFAQWQHFLDMYRDVRRRGLTCVLLFTKADLFRIKLQTTPLTVCFPDYDIHRAALCMMDKYVHAIEFLKRQVPSHKNGKLQSFVVNNCNQEQVQHVVNALLKM